MTCCRKPSRTRVNIVLHTSLGAICRAGEGGKDSDTMHDQGLMIAWEGEILPGGQSCRSREPV